MCQLRATCAVSNSLRTAMGEHKDVHEICKGQAVRTRVAIPTGVRFDRSQYLLRIAGNIDVRVSTHRPTDRPIISGEPSHVQVCLHRGDPEAPAEVRQKSRRKDWGWTYTDVTRTPIKSAPTVTLSSAPIELCLYDM